MNAPCDVILMRRSHVPRAKLWRCHVVPELFGQWHILPGTTTKELRLEPWPGGELFQRMVSPTGVETLLDGCIVLCEEGRRFGFTTALRKGYRPAGTKTKVTGLLEFEDLPEGGTLISGRIRFATSDEAALFGSLGIAESWQAEVDLLEVLAVGLPD